MSTDKKSPNKIVQSCHVPQPKFCHCPDCKLKLIPVNPVLIFENIMYCWYCGTVRKHKKKAQEASRSEQ